MGDPLTRLSNYQLIRLIGLSALSRRYGIPPTWLREEAEEGRIPCVKTGQGFLFDLQAVEHALIERAQHFYIFVKEP